MVQESALIQLLALRHLSDIYVSVLFFDSLYGLVYSLDLLIELTDLLGLELRVINRLLNLHVDVE